MRCDFGATGADASMGARREPTGGDCVMERFSMVYVPLDRNEASKQVIPLASALAEAADATLCFIHAATHNEAATDLLEHLHVTRGQIRNAMFDQFPGRPEDVIPATVNQHPHSIIVMPMSAHPEGGIQELGPVSLAVIKKADCPVVFAPPGHDWNHWKPKRMLLPQDSTEECAAAVAPAVGFSSKSKSHLTLLHVPIYSAGILEPAHHALPLPRYLDQPQHAIRAWQEAFIERLCELGHVPEGVELDLVLGTGDPGEEILAWAKRIQADLIVLPWHRDLETADIFRAVIRGAECPIMSLPIANVIAPSVQAA
ncbi:MAG TPA: hypothetical protein DIS93_06785 [Bdellovibrionales bacterium]|nr:hypothetical protein [Bdellovibrionales bacterium]